MSYIPGWSGTPHICLLYTRQHSQNFAFFTVFNTLQNQQDCSSAKKLLQKTVTYTTQWQKQKLHGTTTVLSHCHTTPLHFTILTAVNTLWTPTELLHYKELDVKRYYIHLPVIKLKLHGKTAFLSHCVLIQPWSDTVAWTKQPTQPRSDRGASMLT